MSPVLVRRLLAPAQDPNKDSQPQEQLLRVTSNPAACHHRSPCAVTSKNTLAALQQSSLESKDSAHHADYYSERSQRSGAQHSLTEGCGVLSSRKKNQLIVDFGQLIFQEEHQIKPRGGFF